MKNKYFIEKKMYPKLPVPNMASNSKSLVCILELTSGVKTIVPVIKAFETRLNALNFARLQGIKEWTQGRKRKYNSKVYNTQSVSKIYTKFTYF